MLNHVRTGPWIPSHLLERIGRSLRQNASDVVRSQFVKFCKARGNAGVGNVDLTCTSKKAFPAPERSDWSTRKSRSAHCKQISAAARRVHCGARLARAGACIKHLQLGNTQSDGLGACRARTQERNQGGPERRTDSEFFAGERRDGLLGRQHRRSKTTFFFANCSFISHGIHVSSCIMCVHIRVYM